MKVNEREILKKNRKYKMPLNDLLQTKATKVTVDEKRGRSPANQREAFNMYQ